MISVQEAYKRAVEFDAQRTAVGVSNICGYTDDWVVFEPVDPEHEGCPGYVVNRKTGEVELNCAMNRKWISPIIKSPEFSAVDLSTGAKIAVE